MSLEQVTPELALAKKMFEHLTKVLQARSNNFDTLLTLFK